MHDKQPIEIPYDQTACDLFVACLRYIIDTCSMQGALMGVEYELAYREMIAKVITTPTPDDASTPALSADQLAQAAAMRRAAQSNDSEAPPTWKAER